MFYSQNLNPSYAEWKAGQDNLVHASAAHVNKDYKPGNPNYLVKVQDQRFPDGWGYMPQGMADGTNHKKYYNAAGPWRKGGYKGKYTPPNLQKGEKYGHIDYGGSKVQSRLSKLLKQPKQNTKQSTQGSGSGKMKFYTEPDKPRYIADALTQDAVGNTMAQGFANADKRFQTKNLDRAGLSRGAGQRFMAAQEGVNSMSQAAQAAADISSADQAANSQMKSSYEKELETRKINDMMMQYNLEQSDWARNFATTMANADLNMKYGSAMQRIRNILFS